MTTGLEIVEDAAAFVLVDEGDIGIEPDEAALALRILNDFCAEQFDLGIDFGYRPLASTSDLVTSPSSVNLALKENLGVLAAPLFGAPVAPDLRVSANQRLKNLRANYFGRIKKQYPSELPMGSGNRAATYSASTFYPFTTPQSILQLNASNTITIATVNTPVILDGWTVDRSVNVTALAAGTVEYLLDSAYLAKFEASLTVNASSSDKFTIYFRKNGALLQQSAYSFTADVVQNLTMSWAETVRRGDKISMAVENNDATNDLVITNGHFTVS